MLSGILLVSGGSLIVISLIILGICVMHDDTREWKLNMMGLFGVTFGFGILLANASGVLDDASGDMLTPSSDIAGMTLILGTLTVFVGLKVMATMNWSTMKKDMRRDVVIARRFIMESSSKLASSKAWASVLNRTVVVKQAAQGLLSR